MKIGINRIFTRIGCCFVFIIASLYAFATVFFSLEFPDTFYHASDYLYSGNLDAFRLLNQGVFLLCIKFFGTSILSTEIVNFLFYYASFVVVYLVFCHPYRMYRYTGLLLTSVALMSLPVGQMTAFNGNSLTVFFLVCTFSFLYKANQNPKYLILLSLSTLCCVLSRFPCFILLPPMIVVSPLIFGDRRKYVCLLVALTISIVLYFAVNALANGGIMPFVHSFSDSLSVATDSSASDHTTSFLLSGYIHTLKDIVGGIKYLSLTVIPLFFVKFTKRKSISLLLFIISLIASLSAVGYSVYKGYGIFYPTQCVLMSGVSVVLFILCVLSVVNKNYRYLGLGLLMLLLSLCSPAGSDSGLVYMVVPMMAFLPAAIIMVKEEIEKIDADDASLLSLSLVGLSGCSFLFVREGSEWIAVCIFALLIIFVIVASIILRRDSLLPKAIARFKTIQTYERPIFARWWIAIFSISMTVLSVWSFIDFRGADRLMQMSDCFDEKDLKGMYTTEECSIFVSDVMNDYRSVCSTNKVVFYGYNSSVFSYLSGVGRVDGSDFSQRENERNKKAFLKAIADYPVVFICAENPVEPALYSIDYYSWFVNTLSERGYDLVDKSTYYVLYPPKI